MKPHRSVALYRCIKCKLWKPRTAFRKSENMVRCRKCVLSAERHKQRRASRFTRSLILAKYGITLDDYDKLLAEQNGGCAICDFEPDEGRFLHVDHDHATNKIRGLLCHRCNQGLGYFRDDRWTLKRAAAYLRSPPANELAINDLTLDWLFSGELLSDCIPLEQWIRERPTNDLLADAPLPRPVSADEAA